MNDIDIIRQELAKNQLCYPQAERKQKDWDQSFLPVWGLYNIQWGIDDKQDKLIPKSINVEISANRLQEGITFKILKAL